MTAITIVITSWLCTCHFLSFCFHALHEFTEKEKISSEYLLHKGTNSVISTDDCDITINTSLKVHVPTANLNRSK